MDKIKSYGAHALAYAASLTAIVAGIDPTLLTAVAGPKALAAIGAATLAGTIIHNLQVSFSKATVTTVAKMLVLFIVTGLTVTSMQGCKTAPSANEQTGITVATYIVAGRAIKEGQESPLVWSNRAERFKATAVKLQEKNDAGTATLATLAADLAPVLAKLNPDERLAADAVISALTPYLQEQANANPVVGYSQERLAVILAAFIRACDAYILTEGSK